MSRDYDEKRDYFRMAADCPLSFTIHGDETLYNGQCINLSAGGVRFHSETVVEPGSLVEINITPDKSVVPPLKAVIEIIRRDATSKANTYEYGGTIKKLL